MSDLADTFWPLQRGSGEWDDGDLAALYDLATFAHQPWRQQAACKGMDTNLFYPARGGTETRQARQVCAGCPVRVECAEYGMADKYGTWGGLTEKDRRRVRRARKLGEAA